MPKTASILEHIKTTFAQRMSFSFKIHIMNRRKPQLMTHNAEITQRSVSETYAKEGLFIKALPGQAVTSKPCYTLKKQKKEKLQSRSRDRVRFHELDVVRPGIQLFSRIHICNASIFHKPHKPQLQTNGSNLQQSD